MAGFNTSPKPSDRSDLQVSPLDMQQFTEVYSLSNDALRKLRAAATEEQMSGADQMSNAMAYLQGAASRGAETPDDILMSVRQDVHAMTPDVIADVVSENVDPATLDLSKAGKFSAQYGLGIGVKALTYLERVVGDPGYAQTLNAWNTAGVENLMADIALSPTRIPEISPPEAIII